MAGAVIDPDNRVMQCCIEGSHAEFEGRLEDAAACYQLAWDAAQDDYEACMAAHYLARVQATPDAILHWNREALRRADVVPSERVQDFYPSLYLSMGYACEQVDAHTEAQDYYDLAASLGAIHQQGASPRTRSAPIPDHTQEE